jgi:hypothetical protein
MIKKNFLFNHKEHKEKPQRNTKEKLHILLPFVLFVRTSCHFVVKKSIITVLIFCISCNLFCQNENLSETTTDIAEDLAEQESDPEAAALFVDLLNELSENPVRINSGDESEISRLFFLSRFQIMSLTDHINKSGGIVSVYELASLPGFDRRTAEIMTPFISLRNIKNNLPQKLKTRNTLCTSFISKPGETDTSVLGSPLKILSKYKITTGPFSAGMTIEKDAGEKFLSGSPPIPDFLSSYILYSGKGIVRKVIIGNYSARFGEGTNINSLMRTGLSAIAPGLMSGHDEIKPYTSSDENIFFKGAAITLSARNLDLSILCSHKRSDASTSWSVDSSKQFVTGFYKGGLHNTESLLLKKDAVAETFFGININYSIQSVRFGLTWSESRFSLPLMLSGNDPEDFYGFDGKMSSVCSVYYNTLIKRILLFGEISADNSLDHAIIQGITLRPSDRLSVNFLYRDYSPGYTAFHGRGPGINSTTTNETGLLGNITFEAAKHLFISAGSDIAWFPWAKYRTSFPSYAKRQEFKIRYTTGENFSAEVSYNYRYSMSDGDDKQGVASIKDLSSGTLKGIFKYSPLERLTLSTRFDHKIVSESGCRGALLFQDINYTFRRAPFKVWLRYSIFDTDDWNSRIYVYENDLLYSFCIPVFSGKGSRTYAMVEWEIGDIVELRIKYGITSLIEKGCCTRETDELKMQLRLFF